jgi:hypothetical protein
MGMDGDYGVIGDDYERGRRGRQAPAVSPEDVQSERKENWPSYDMDIAEDEDSGSFGIQSGGGPEHVCPGR